MVCVAGLVVPFHCLLREFFPFDLRRSILFETLSQTTPPRTCSACVSTGYFGFYHIHILKDSSSHSAQISSLKLESASHSFISQPFAAVLFFAAELPICSTSVQHMPGLYIQDRPIPVDNTYANSKYRVLGHTHHSRAQYVYLQQSTRKEICGLGHIDVERHATIGVAIPERRQYWPVPWARSLIFRMQNTQKM